MRLLYFLLGRSHANCWPIFRIMSSRASSGKEGWTINNPINARCGLQMSAATTNSQKVKESPDLPRLDGTIYCTVTHKIKCYSPQMLANSCIRIFTARSPYSITVCICYTFVWEATMCSLLLWPSQRPLVLRTFVYRHSTARVAHND